MQLSEDLAAVVVESTAVAIVASDASGTILLFNPCAERLFGYAAHEMLGNNISRLMPAAMRADHDGYLHDYRRTGTRRIIGTTRDVVGTHRDGTPLALSVSVSEASLEGNTLFVAAVRTAARFTHAPPAGQARAAPGRAPSTPRNDLNNLLTVIVGNAEWIRERLPNQPDIKKACDAIHDASLRCAQTVAQLRAPAPLNPPPSAAIDSSSTARDARERRTAGRASDYWPCDRRMQVRADWLQVGAAVLDLAHAAQRRMRDGGTLSLTFSHVAVNGSRLDEAPGLATGDYVCVTIGDDGEPADDRDLHALSEVRRFAHESQGAVATASRPGAGTTVHLYLPARKSDGRTP